MVDMLLTPDELRIALACAVMGFLLGYLVAYEKYSRNSKGYTTKDEDP